jgi:hypothetical protein
MRSIKIVSLHPYSVTFGEYTPRVVGVPVYVPVVACIDRPGTAPDVTAIDVCGLVIVRVQVTAVPRVQSLVSPTDRGGLEQVVSMMAIEKASVPLLQLCAVTV